MMRKLSIIILSILMILSFTSILLAEDKKPKENSDDSSDIVVTKHEVVIGGQKIIYQVTTGTMNWSKDGGDPKAKVFFMAYTRTDVDTDKPEARPLTFSFNGGPGSSSVWLHLGVLGPRRVLMAEDGAALAPPYELVANEYSLLDKTDLVFIDPVGTGYSRAVEGEDAHQFHGVNEDIESVGEFIRLYITEYERWLSPKFLIGESYGTLRAAGLSGYLQGNHGIYLNGIMLISSILEYQTARFSAGNDLPYILFLPTYTATAYYHKQLDDELMANLEKTIDEVRAFALGDYATALLEGDRLDKAKEAEIVTKLARYTGLSEEYIRETNLRVQIWRFTKELLRDQRRTVGRLDSRFIGIDEDAAGESYDYDPSYAAIQGPYSTLLNDYVRCDLGYKTDLPYEILTGRVHPWSYEAFQNRYVNTATTLRSAMTKNRNLKVFVANGYFDLATPFFATEHTFNHLGLDESLRGNVTMSYYQSGHMMYINIPSLIKLKTDLDNFINSAL